MTYKAVTQRVILTAIENCLVDMLILFRLVIVSQSSVSPIVFTLYPGTEPVDSLLTSSAKAPLHGMVLTTVLIPPVLESYLMAPNLSQQLTQSLSILYME